MTTTPCSFTAAPGSKGPSSIWSVIVARSLAFSSRLEGSGEDAEATYEDEEWWELEEEDAISPGSDAAEDAEVGGMAAEDARGGTEVAVAAAELELLFEEATEDEELLVLLEFEEPFTSPLTWKERMKD